MRVDRASTIKVHSAIAKALVHHDVNTMFGLVGDANLFMVDSFIRDYGGKFVASAHEAGATSMAIGYAAISGTVGVATVTLGPGVTNTMTALVEGVKGSVPSVLLCGDLPKSDLHGISNVNHRDFIVAAGAGYEELRSPETVAHDVATVFQRAVEERRPIALNMPVDFQWDTIEFEPVKHRITDRRAVAPSSGDLDDAIGIIAMAKRPIILVGRGALDPAARKSIKRLAERTDALLATTLKAKDLFKGEPHNLGLFGTLSSNETVDAVTRSDCVVSFGASLNPYTTSYGAFLDGKRVVQINLEHDQIARYQQPDVGVVGDPALVADTIVRVLDEAEIEPSGYRTEFSGQDRSDTPFIAEPASKNKQETIDVGVALRAINDVVPQNRKFVTDGGRFLKEAWCSIDVADPNDFLHTVNYGSIGLGLPQAIGVSMYDSGRPTLLVTGDGGFMLGGLAEFNTAVRHGCDLIAVICNDGSYGAEHVQFRDRGMDPALSLFDWPDFAPVAISLGGAGVTVRGPEDLEKAAAAIKNRDGPLLIDIKLDPDRMPRLG